MNDKTDKFIEHPLEELFDIEPGTTLVSRPSTEISLIEHDDYDEKDKEIEEQFEQIYQKAIDAFEVQSDIVDTVEGKYAARNAEVAATMLQAALAAVNGKKDIKQAKDKIKAKNGSDGGNNKAGTTNIIIDRNDLLKEILGINSPKDVSEKPPIEGEKE